MPLAVEGGDVVLHDGPVAAAALGREHVEVVVAAVGLAVTLVEALLAELLAALCAEEVLRVPGLLQRGHTFLKPKPASRMSKRSQTIRCKGRPQTALTSRMGPLQYAQRGEKRLW